jgi:exonuclease SbcC
MIILKKLKIYNFLSHKNTDILFPENAQISIEGVSGSGKSSIIDAIIWCLFGKGRSDNRNLIRSGQKECIVALELTDDNTSYLIERKTTSAGKQTLEISLKKNDDEYSAIQKTGLKDHQMWIEKELLHSSYPLFINSIAYPQENTENFVRQTASKRKDLLLEIARTSDYDIYYNRAKDKLQSLQEHVMRLTTKAEMHEGIINDSSMENMDSSKLEEKKIQLNQAIKEIESDTQKLLKEREEYKSLSEKIDAIQHHIREKEENIEEQNSKIIIKQVRIETLSTIDISAIEKKLIELSSLKEELIKLEEIAQYNAERQKKLNIIINTKPSFFDYDTVISELNKKIISVINQENIPCPDGKHCSCFLKSFKERECEFTDQLGDIMKKQKKQEIEMDEYTKQLNSIEPERGDGSTIQKINEIKQRIQILSRAEIEKGEFESRSLVIDDLMHDVDEIKESIHKNKKNIQKYNEELVMLKNAISNIDITNIDNKKNEYERLTKKMNDDLSSCIKDLSFIEITKKNIEKSKNELLQIHEDVDRLNKEMKYISYIKDAFGSKGIKTILIDYLIPQLENSINDILEKLSDFRIKLETQKQTVDGESIIEGLFISIFNENGEEFDFSNYSGGQKLKISVAISEALASIQKIGFRIFDETFIGLDEASTDSFSEVMESLQSRFPQILCISHLRMIQDRFENKLIVTKNSQYSEAQLI